MLFLLFIYFSFPVSSPAVSCYFWRKRFLLLGCIDGTFRVMDTLGKPPTKTFSLPTQKLEALRCVKVAKGKVRIFHSPITIHLFKLF
jgi:hypothetical protein